MGLAACASSGTVPRPRPFPGAPEPPSSPREAEAPAPELPASFDREVREQVRLGKEVGLRRVQPGDLLFFETVARGASHVGVAISPDEFVHAPSSRGRVRVERFSTGYWAARLVGVRRIQ
jgi:hypothetical protein